MPVREVFEAPFAIEEGFVGCGEGLDHGHEVAVVVHEFQLNGPQMARVAGDGQCSVSLIPISLDQRLKAEAFQALGHGAAVPR